MNNINNFKEKLDNFLKENKEGVIDNKNEKPVKKMIDDKEVIKEFIKYVNPVRGEIKKNSLFRYIVEFRKRNRDIIILKGDKNSEVYPFYAVDREKFTAFISTIIDEEEKIKEFSEEVQSIYLPNEETELNSLEDYIDFAIKNNITIVSNPASESEIEMPTSPFIGSKQEKEDSEEK